MTKTLTALVAAVTLAIATATVPTAADARCPGCVGEPPPYAPPGYVYYPAYGQQLPGPNCYWFRMPVYDAYGNMVSWRGRPVGFCSWLARVSPGLPALTATGDDAGQPRRTGAASDAQDHDYSRRRCCSHRGTER